MSLYICVFLHREEGVMLNYIFARNTMELMIWSCLDTREASPQQNNWVYASPWSVTEGIHGCWESWLMNLQDHSWISLKCCGDQERFPMIRRNKCHILQERWEGESRQQEASSQQDEEELILETISGYTNATGSSKHGFMKGKPCLISLKIIFNDD